MFLTLTDGDALTGDVHPEVCGQCITLTVLGSIPNDAGTMVQWFCVVFLGCISVVENESFGLRTLIGLGIHGASVRIISYLYPLTSKPSDDTKARDIFLSAQEACSELGIGHDDDVPCLQPSLRTATEFHMLEKQFLHRNETLLCGLHGFAR